MKRCEIELNGKQYAMLEKMLSRESAQRLAMNQPLDAGSLFADILYEIYSPVEDGWSTPETVMQESAEQLGLLRTLTAAVYPEDADFFVRQLGCEEPVGAEDTEIVIRLRF